MIRISKSFILIFILTAAAAFTLGGTLPYYSLYFLSIAFVIGLIYTAVQKFTIDAEASVEDKVYKVGDSIECLTVVKCGLFIPAPYVLVESESFKNDVQAYNGELVNLTNDENSWIRNKIKFYSRGIYDFGAIKIKVDDLFHILSFSKTIDSDVKVKVYPKIYELKRLTFGGRDIYQQVINLRSKNEDIFSLKDVRRYNPGDSMKKVHWKASAKRGELFVKNSDTIAGEEFIIFLDMNKKNLLLDEKGYMEESMVDFCCSLAKHMQNRGIYTKVFLNCKDNKVVDINTKEKLDKLMEMFLTQKSDGQVELSEYLYRNFYKLNRNNKLAVISGKIDDKLCKNITKIRNLGYDIALFYADKNQSNVEQLAFLKTIGIECRKISNVLESCHEEGEDAYGKHRL